MEVDAELGGVGAGGGGAVVGAEEAVAVDVGQRFELGVEGGVQLGDGGEIALVPFGGVFGRIQIEEGVAELFGPGDALP